MRPPRPPTTRSSVDANDSTPAATGFRLGLPYGIGDAFIDVIRNRGGSEAVNDAFAHPPDEYAVLNPETYLVDPDEQPVAVWRLYTLMASEFPPDVAFDIVSGAASASFELDADNDTCALLSIAPAIDVEKSIRDFADATGTGDVTIDNDTVIFRRCQGGSGASDEEMEIASDHLFGHHALLAEALSQDSTNIERAACIAEYGAADLGQGAEFDDAYDNAASTC